MPALRLPVVDGLFYPAAPATLRAQVADCLAAVGADDRGTTRPSQKLLITAHADYEYCGAVAASAYARLAGPCARSISLHDVDGGTTFCPRCRAALIRRDWYEVLRCDLDASGACPQCGTAIAGRFGEFRRGFGRRRVPVCSAAA